MKIYFFEWKKHSKSWENSKIFCYQIIISIWILKLLITNMFFNSKKLNIKNITWYT